MSLASLAVAWRTLPDELRASSLRVASTSTGYVLASESFDASASRTASLLGLQTEARSDIDLTTALTPRLVHAKSPTNVRGTPDGAVLRVVPALAVLVAYEGQIGSQNSSSSGTDAWTFVVINGTESGWISSAQLEADALCVPTLPSLGDHHAEDSRDAFIATTTLSRVAFHHDGVSVRGFVATARNADAPLSSVALYLRDDTCNLTRIRHFYDAGVPKTIFLAKADEAGTRTLLVVEWERAAEDAPGLTRWSFVAPGDESSSIERWMRTGSDVPRAQRERVKMPIRTGPSGEPGFWPIGIESGGATTIIALENGELVEHGPGGGDEPREEYGETY